jgi:PAS domain S-box-containing protein
MNERSDMTAVPIRVLLVEDNPDDARLVRGRLERAPGLACSVDHVVGLREARAHLRDGLPPDIVLLDLSLPDSAGVDTVRDVVDAAPEVPVIVLTGSADEHLPIETLRSGAQDYLSKDAASERALSRVIRHAIERARRERELIGRSDLRESEVRFRVALRNTPIIVSTVDRQLRYTWLYNPHPGFQAESCIGKRDDELAPPEHVAELMDLKQEVLDSGRGRRREVRVKVGPTAHHYDVTAEPLRDASGEVTGVAVAASDITERKRTVQHREFLARVGPVLSSSLDYEEMLRFVTRLAVPELADWCVVDVLTEDGRLQSVQTAAADARKEELLHSMLELHPHTTSPEQHPVGAVLRGGKGRLLQEITPEMLDRVAQSQSHREILQELAPVSSMVVPLVAHDRTLGAITLTAAESGRRFDEVDLDLAEEVGRRCALAVWNAHLHREVRRAREQVTRLQRATAALAEALTVEEVMEVAVKHGMEAVHATSGSLVVVDDAGCELAILRSAGLPGDVVDGLPDESPSPLCGAVRSGKPLFFDSKEAFVRAYPGRGASMARQLAGSLAVIPLLRRRQPAGALVFGFESWRTISTSERELLLAIVRQSGQALERADLFEREREAVLARDEVLGIVAHDLRNPLSAINMYAELLEHALPPDADARKYGEMVRKVCEQADRLIQDLLDVGRVEAGHLRVQRRPLPADRLVGQAVEMLRATAIDAGIAFDAEIIGQPPLVSADPDRIAQVLSNLVGNALKFTPRGGRVKLQIEPGANEVLFTVSDTGPGIAPEHREHLFDRFWQADKATRTGAGLGLPIARGIVEAHGGRIWAENEVDSGSRFTFTLPAAGPPAVE